MSKFCRSETIETRRGRTEGGVCQEVYRKSVNTCLGRRKEKEEKRKEERQRGGSLGRGQGGAGGCLQSPVLLNNLK